MISIDIAHNLTEIIVGLFAIIGTLIGFIAWFIRLESKVLYLEKDHEKREKAVQAKDDAFWAKMDTMQATLNQVLQVVGELKGRVEK